MQTRDTLHLYPMPSTPCLRSICFHAHTRSTSSTLTFPIRKDVYQLIMFTSSKMIKWIIKIVNVNYGFGTKHRPTSHWYHAITLILLIISNKKAWGTRTFTIKGYISHDKARAVIVSLYKHAMLIHATEQARARCCATATMLASARGTQSL